MQRPLWPGVSLWLSRKALEAAVAQVGVPAVLLVAVAAVPLVLVPVVLLVAVAAILQ